MANGSSYTNVFGGSTVSPSQPSYLALTMATSTQLVWPLETTEGSPGAASAIDVIATAGTSLLMPPGNTGSTGIISLISNVGANSFNVTDTAGNAICTIATTQAWLLVLTDNSTVNGTWRAYQMASTVSSAVAAALAGPGLKAAGSLLETNFVTILENANTLLTAAFRAKAVIWTGASGTLSFDAIANLTAGWYCAISNQGSGALTISTTDGSTINGAATLVMQPGNSGFFICGSSTFYSVGALIGPLSILNGGTGASTANGALTNLGGTSIGISIFTAASAAAVVSLLGLQVLPLLESTVGTNQNASTSSGGTAYVCTTGLTITLPLTTSVTTQYVLYMLAQGGIVTVTPQSADSINGQTAGTSYAIPQGQSAMFVTDAAGKWWPFFVNGISILLPAFSGTITVAVSGPTVIMVDSSSGAVAVQLPGSGGPYTVKDVKGAAGTNKITVTWNGGTIDDQPNAVLNFNYQSLTIAQYGSNGAII